MDASRRTGWGTEASSGSAPREAQGPIDQDVGNASGTDSSESSFDSSETESGSDNPQRPAPASRNQADADAKARRRTQSARDDDEKSAKRNGYGGDAARGAARADYASEIPPRADAPTTAADPPPQHDSLPPSPSPPPAVKERIKARDVSRRSGDSTVSGASNAPKSERGVAGGAGPPSRDIHIGSKVVISREGKGKNHLQYSLLFSPTPLPRHLSSSAVLFFFDAAHKKIAQGVRDAPCDGAGRDAVFKIVWCLTPTPLSSFQLFPLSHVRVQRAACGGEVWSWEGSFRTWTVDRYRIVQTSRYVFSIHSAFFTLTHLLFRAHTVCSSTRQTVP